MSDQIIATIKGESADLELHVDLCHQRYLQILSKIDAVTARLDDVTLMLHEIRNKLETNTENSYKTYLKWAGAIIIALFGLVAGHMIK